jgi:hypothetical protein
LLFDRIVEFTHIEEGFLTGGALFERLNEMYRLNMGREKLEIQKTEEKKMRKKGTSLSINVKNNFFHDTILSREVYYG